MKKFVLFKFLVFVLLLAESSSDVLLSEFSDEEYFQMPDLFALDNYDRCMSRKDGVFCIGTFVLSSPGPNHIYDIIKKISDNPLHFNHTKTHRGICLGSQDCPLNSSLSREQMFQNCVNNDMRKHYGLEAHLVEFDFCKSRDDRRPWDGFDSMFVVYASVILALNVLATYYDVSVKDKNGEGNRWILSFSLSTNWRRFKEGSTGGADPRYTNFKCFNGLKAVLTLLVHLAHVPLTMLIFSANPRFIENMNKTPEFAVLTNGTVVIQTFLVMSTFLCSFKILLDSEKSKPGLKTVLLAALDRFIRICPLFMSAVGFTATVMAHVNDGPLWRKYVETEADVCRANFWTKFFLLQHWYSPECLPQAWYLSVDFQLYVVCTGILVYYIRKKTYVFEKLAAIFVASIFVLFAIIYALELKPSLQSMTPEALLELFKEDKSFILLYQSIWGNFPGAILGTLGAYVYYTMTQKNINLNDSKWFRIAFHLTIPAMAVYSLMGYLVRHSMTSRTTVSLYATLDKPGYAIIILIFILGCLFQVDHVYRRAMEWPGWIPIGRLSLTSLLFHVSIARLFLATKLYPPTFSRTDTVFNWFSIAIGTFIVSLPITLMIEQPFMQLYKNVTITLQKKKDVNRNKLSVNGNGVTAKLQLNGNGVTAKLQLNGNGVAAKSQLNGNGVAAKSQLNGNGVAAKSQLKGSGVATKSDNGTAKIKEN